MGEVLYKVLGADGEAIHGGSGAWHLPKGKRPGKWMPKVTCPGSGQPSDRVHPSGTIVCPACNGAYPSSGFAVPDHLALAEEPAEEADRG